MSKVANSSKVCVGNECSIHPDLGWFTCQCLCEDEGATVRTQSPWFEAIHRFWQNQKTWALLLLGLWQTDREEEKGAEGHQDKLWLGLLFWITAIFYNHPPDNALICLCMFLHADRMTDHFFLLCMNILHSTWSHTVDFFVPTPCLIFPVALPSLLSVVCFAVSAGLINQAAWQVNVRNGWVSVWRGRRVGCRCMYVYVSGEGREGERESQLLLST